MMDLVSHIYMFWFHCHKLQVAHQLPLRNNHHFAHKLYPEQYESLPDHTYYVRHNRLQNTYDLHRVQSYTAE